jgi:hypothetical protein
MSLLCIFLLVAAPSSKQPINREATIAFARAQESLINEARAVVHPSQVLSEPDSLLLLQLRCECYQIRMQARKILKETAKDHIRLLIWGELSKDPEVAPFCSFLLDTLSEEPKEVPEEEFEFSKSYWIDCRDVRQLLMCDMSRH